LLAVLASLLRQSRYNLGMQWSWLADGVLLVHAAYVGYVVFGLAAILLGVVLNWGWVRNFYFRATHLGAIALVAAESIVGMDCPLTTLENRLRIAAGEDGGQSGCIAYWVQPLIFFNFPQWVFTAAYLAFAAMVGAVFWMAPPNLNWAGNSGHAQVRPRQQNVEN
jgi:hypothetical protein